MSDSEELDLSSSDGESEAEADDGSDFDADGAVSDDDGDDFEADDEEDDEDFAPKRSKKAGQASAAAARKPAAKAKAKPAAKSAAAGKAAPKKAGGGSKGAAKAASASSGPTSIAASAAAAGKGSIKEKDAPKVVLEYMNVQNRPYSLINVFDNLHGAVKKASLGRVLDALAAEGHLKSKTYGKATIFWPDQAQYGEITDEMVAEQRARVTGLQSQQTEASSARRSAEAAVVRLKALPSTEELRAKAAKAEEETEALRARLRACEEAAAAREADEGAGASSSAASGAKSRRPPLVRGKGKKELDPLLRRYVKVWKDRRRMVMDVVGQIEEGTSMKLKAVLDKAGIETDEEAGAVDPRTLV